MLPFLLVLFFLHLSDGYGFDLKANIDIPDEKLGSAFQNILQDSLQQTGQTKIDLNKILVKYIKPQTRIKSPPILDLLMDNIIKTDISIGNHERQDENNIGRAFKLSTSGATVKETDDQQVNKIKHKLKKNKSDALDTDEETMEISIGGEIFREKERKDKDERITKVTVKEKNFKKSHGHHSFTDINYDDEELKDKSESEKSYKNKKGSNENLHSLALMEKFGFFKPYEKESSSIETLTKIHVY